MGKWIHQTISHCVKRQSGLMRGKCRVKVRAADWWKRNEVTEETLNCVLVWSQMEPWPHSFVFEWLFCPEVCRFVQIKRVFLRKNNNNYITNLPHKVCVCIKSMWERQKSLKMQAGQLKRVKVGSNYNKKDSRYITIKSIMFGKYSLFPLFIQDNFK